MTQKHTLHSFGAGSGHSSMEHVCFWLVHSSLQISGPQSQLRSRVLIGGSVSQSHSDHGAQSPGSHFSEDLFWYKFSSKMYKNDTPHRKCIKMILLIENVQKYYFSSKIYKNITSHRKSDKMKLTTWSIIARFFFDRVSFASWSWQIGFWFIEIGSAVAISGTALSS